MSYRASVVSLSGARLFDSSELLSQGSDLLVYGRTAVTCVTLALLLAL